LKMPVEDAELAYGIPERQVTQLELKNPGPACTIDEAGDREQEIYRAALNYVKELLGNDVGGAFEAMSKEGRKALTRDQLATAARVLQEFKPQHINVQHWYVIELGSKTGASPIEDEPLERVVCGNNPEKPDGWVSVAVTNDPEQAYVVFSADSTNHELALTAWLVRQGNQWMVYGFSFSLATLGSKGPIELWEQARAERRRGHQLNGVLLFGAAEDLVDRGSYFTLGIQSKILQDAPTFVKPPELQGMPPYLWRTSQRTWKVLNVSLTASAGKIFVMISHEVEPWQSDDQVDSWNKALLFYFKSRFPEYSEVFAGLVANAYEQGTKRQYRTVDDNLRSPDDHLVAGR
jgi:hypothetical protein